MMGADNVACSGNETNKPEHPAEINQLINWLQLAAAAGTDMFQLLQLELRLAIADLKRLFILALLFLPILLLTWISASTLLAWLAYQQNTSITQGLMAFCLLQCLALTSIFLAWRFYKRSLSLPLTRQHIRRFIAGDPSES